MGHITTSSAVTGAIRLTILVLIAAGAVGCESVEQQYGRRHLVIPEPVAAAELPDEALAGALKPVGVQTLGSDRARDALPGPELYLGSGYVAARPQAREGVAVDPTGERVSLNFVNTGLLEVVDTTLGRTLGLNYVFDERVEGTVTARTSAPIPRAAVLPMLENILALNGAALVESGGVYNVVPVASVPSMPKVVVTPSRSPQRPGTVISVIPLEFASVTSVQEVIASMVSPGNQLAVDAARNILIYTGPAQEARSIAELVSVLDVDVLAGMSFGLFPVEASSAEDVASELEVLFSDEAIGGLTDPVRFLPIERLNAILAISSRPSNLRQVAKWVSRLDRADVGAGERVFVYYARNSRALDLADVLNEVFGSGEGRRDEGERPSPIAPGLEPVRLIAPTLESGADGESAAAFAPTGQRAPSAGRETRPRVTSQGGNGIRFVADERNNALVVISTTEQFRMIEATLNRLDILPLQVLIEATIAEVSLTKGLEYGLQWAFENGDLSGSLNDAIEPVPFPGFGVNQAVPGFNLILDATEVQAVLRALATVTDVEVISSPHLMVLDNQQARLQVGDRVPVSTQSAESVLDSDARIVNSIELIDTGVILEVTPRVNATGLVTLEISQEVSDAVRTQTSGINSPTIEQRSIRSIVAVQSGETVALGGLIRERSEEGESGLPVLKDIPVLGNLFKSTSRDSTRTELLVLITPRVIRGPTQAREVTNELRQRLTSLRDVVNATQ